MTTQQKKSAQRQGFKTGEYIVYPAHGVGQIVTIEEQEVVARLRQYVGDGEAVEATEHTEYRSSLLFSSIRFDKW